MARATATGERLSGGAARGFTLVELLVVLLVVALLASLVAPVVVGGIERAKESTLREDLYVLRKAIDDFYADTGRYPAELEDLVAGRYLRRVPPDPVTGSRESWVLVRIAGERAAKGEGVIDVRSGSSERASDGSYFRDW